MFHDISSSDKSAKSSARRSVWANLKDRVCGILTSAGFMAGTWYMGKGLFNTLQEGSLDTYDEKAGFASRVVMTGGLARSMLKAQKEGLGSGMKAAFWAAVASGGSYLGLQVAEGIADAKTDDRKVIETVEELRQRELPEISEGTAENEAPEPGI